LYSIGGSVPEQPNNAGRGPLGVPTNSPISDPGTSARIQNRPNVPIGTVAPRNDARKSTARLGGNRELRTDRFPLLKVGARGNDVQRLQRLLNIHVDGDEQLKVDGIFGPKTRAAVLEFQKDEDLKPDAVVGRDTWFSLVSAGTQEASWKAKPPAPPTKVVASSSTTATKKTVDQWTLAERFEYVLQHCAPYLGPDMRAQFTALLTPTNLGIMVGSLVVWAAGHFFGVSEIADAFLLGFGLVFLGKAAIDAARLLKNVIEITCAASTEAELEDAAKDLAEAIAIIGVVAFFALLAKVGRAIGNKLKAAKAAEKGGAPSQEGAAPESKSNSETEKSKAEEESKRSPEELIAQRKATALKFYRSTGWPEEKIAAHMKGIDFSKPVEVTTLKPGTTVSQWQRPGAPQGNYYAPPGTDPATLGIDTAGRVETQYVVKQSVQVLKSTAADMPDWNGSGATYRGGGTQLFTTDGSAFQAK
jgi:peptidoglycan hydrolase-like protein with peptidoglycan-binding domain